MANSTPPSVRADSLVLYKSSPARVLKMGDKIEIEIKGGETQRVRPKDIQLLHPGPLGGFSDLAPLEGDVISAWDLLQGTTTGLAELCELIYGKYTPASAWAAWQLVADGLYFRGAPEAIEARPAEEVEKEKAARESAESDKKAWEELMARVRSGKCQPTDKKELGEVEAVAFGKSQRSRVLKELGTLVTPENAHALLLRLGVWDETINPYPRRDDMPFRPPDVALSALEDEPRRDLTQLPAFAIDDEGNKDPDDAISLEGDTIWIHIADVAALIAPDSPADLEARGRGANLYLPEVTVPMLPPRATELLGLGLQEISPALSFGVKLADDGSLAAVEVVASRVRVTRLTYEEADKRMDEAPFRELHALAKRFQARRLARGSGQIEYPEVKIKVVEGEVVIRPLPRLKSRELVTEAMLMGGEAAARFAIEHRIPFPFTTQVPPERVERPKDLAGMFHYRKQFKPSQNKTSAEPHAGLGIDAYARATSPLRRYLDLVVHQQLRAHLRGAQVLGPQEVLSRVGAAEAVLGHVRRVERFSNQHWTLVHLHRNPDWKGRAVLLEKFRGRATVVIPELALETRLALPTDPPLNAEVPLRQPKVDLARLSAHFQVGE